MPMDLSDERLHRKRVVWPPLERDGFDPKLVMLEAQRQKMWKLASSAKTRVEVVRRAKEKMK